MNSYFNKLPDDTIMEIALNLDIEKSSIAVSSFEPIAGRGQMIEVNNNSRQKIPIKLESFNNVKKISCGELYSIVLLENGNLYSFGNNKNGQLGIGNNRDSYIPVKIESL